MTVDYLGLRPPQLNVPLIELETPDGTTFDLYNDSMLRGVVLDRHGLAFEFTTHDARNIVVRFSAIRNLRVEQPADWVPEEYSQIEHLLIREEGPWQRVEFKAGGFDYQFDCDALCLIVAKT